MKKLVFCFLVLLYNNLQAQTVFRSNVSLVSKTEKNFYLPDIMDYLYDCNDQGEIITKNKVSRLSKDFLCADFQKQNDTWVKTAEFSFNVTNIGKIYFIEYGSASLGYVDCYYSLSEKYLYLYTFNKSFVGEGRVFNSTEEYRDFVTKSFDYSTDNFLNKPIKLYRYATLEKEENTRNAALVVGGGLLLLKALFGGGDGGSSSSGNFGAYPTEQSQSKYVTGYDENRRPIYDNEQNYKKATYDENGNKKDNN